MARLGVVGAPSIDPEAAISAALAAGDHRRALVVLMDVHGPAVLRYCERMLGDIEAARDVRQVVFVQAYQGMSEFRGQSSVRGWLFGIARHRCLDALKASRYRRYDALPEEPAPASGARQESESWALQQALLGCLQELDADTRESLLLRCQDGFSFPELARMLGEREGTLKARVLRAAQRLRRCLGNQGVGT